MFVYWIRTKPFTKYNVKNIHSGEIHICEGLKDVIQLIGKSKSSAQKVTKGIPVNGCPFIGVV